MDLDDDDTVFLGLSHSQLLLVSGAALAVVVILVVLGCCIGYMFKRYKLYGAAESDMKALENEKSISDKKLQTRDSKVNGTNDNSDQMSDDLSDIVSSNEQQTPEPRNESRRMQSANNYRNQQLNRHGDEAMFVYRSHENRYSRHEIGRQKQLPIVDST